MKSKFRREPKIGKYKMSAEEVEVMYDFQNQSGFDLMHQEEIHDGESFLKVMIKNHEWLKNWALDVVIGNEMRINEMRKKK